MNTRGPASRSVFHQTPRSSASGKAVYSSRGREDVPGCHPPRVLMRSDLRLSFWVSFLVADASKAVLGTWLSPVSGSTPISHVPRDAPIRMVGRYEVELAGRDCDAIF